MAFIPSGTRLQMTAVFRSSKYFSTTDLRRVFENLGMWVVSLKSKPKLLSNYNETTVVTAFKMNISFKSEQECANYWWNKFYGDGINAKVYIKRY